VFNIDNTGGKLMANSSQMAYLVGAGPGDYQLITLKAVACLKKADVVIYDRLANKRYLDFAKEGAELLYVGKASSCHSLPQDEINRLLIQKAKEGKTVVRLKGGDPYLFGRGGEEAEELKKEGIPFEIVPGITSAISVPAYAGIPVTHRDFVSSVHIITGHEKPDKDVSTIDYDLLARLKGTLIFLMGLSKLKGICQSLIKHGKPLDTPVAVISKGTTSAQKKVVGTLSDIGNKVREEKLLPPSIIIMGEVVTLHDKLDWFFKKPLSGKRVLVTRSRSQASMLAEKIEDLGGEVYTFPTIKILEPEDFTLIDEKLVNIEGYNWIIFTSVNGVVGFFRRLKFIKKDIRSLTGIKLGAIGEKTGAALEEIGLIPDYIPGEYQGEALAEGLKERIKPGEKVLLPTADIARKLLENELTTHGAIVHKVDLYRTVQGEGNQTLLLEWLKQKELDLITFASSSTVQNFMHILGVENISLLQGVKIACIGPVTAKTAEELGLDVSIIAKDYTIDGLVEAILSKTP
jgi:uroporphyrinogen III methyltransferase/synthase